MSEGHKLAAMNWSPPRYIRVRVFEMTQAAFGELLGISQSGVARIEASGDLSARLQRRILDLAEERGIAFDPQWFFTVPPSGDDDDEDEAA